MHGWRGRIGLLVPATNTIMEPEFYRHVPEGVTVHSGRVPFERNGHMETLLSQEAGALAAAELIAACEPDVVVYGCTSGSFVGGVEWNARMTAELERACACPAITTTAACVASLKRRGITRVDIVTPYVKATNERLVAFLEATGIAVESLAGFDMLDVFEHANIASAEIYRLARKTASPRADGLFISCTQLRSWEISDVLESDLDRPVVTANRASFEEAMLYLRGVKSAPVTLGAGA